MINDDDDLQGVLAEEWRVIAHQCDAIREIAKAWAMLHESGEPGPRSLVSMQLPRTRELMNNLGDILNGMDAISEEDEWVNPIIERANQRI